MAADAGKLSEQDGNERGGGKSAEVKLSFRKDGDARAFCRTGWSEPEETETWCVGPRATLTLPAPARPGPHVLVLNARPHVAPGHLAAQRLGVIVNGVAVGAFTLHRRAVRACLVPASALAGRESLEIAFETPDAARPSDFGPNKDGRALAAAFFSLRLYPDRFASAAPPTDDGADGETAARPVDIDAVMRADRMPLSRLMLQFESLGQNCEFGLVQRKCEAEPLGLLRFASTPLPNLLAALEAGFAGMGEPDAVRVDMSGNGREFMVKDACYGVTYHAWVNAGEMSAEELHRREARRVPLLVRKLLEDLESGEKTFVFKGMGALPEEEVFPLAAALRRHGPNTLLFVTLADAEHRAGTVETRAPGFFVGYLDRFAPGEDAHDFLLDQWISICRAACRMMSFVPTSALQ